MGLPCTADMDILRRRGRKFDEMARRLYACNTHELTESERVLLMRINIDFAIMLDEIKKISEAYERKEAEFKRLIALEKRSE